MLRTAWSADWPLKERKSQEMCSPVVIDKGIWRAPSLYQVRERHQIETETSLIPMPLKNEP
jgi:hypothetical protein